MKTTLEIMVIVVSILIVTFVLLQGRGAGLGSAWGGGGEMYQTRRGVEKLTMQLTILLILVFFGIGVVNFFVK